MITKELWHVFMPLIVMPDLCTHEQFVAVREVIWREQDIKFENEQLEGLIELRDMTKYSTGSELREIMDGYNFLIDQVAARLTGLLNA